MISPSRYWFKRLLGILGRLEKNRTWDQDTSRYRFTRPRSFFARMITW